MQDNKDGDRDPARTQPGTDAGKETAGETADWETRALERMRDRVGHADAEGEQDEAGWEVSTVTLLETYFQTRRI